MTDQERRFTYYSITEAARMLGVTRTTIWRWCDEGRFPNMVRLSATSIKRGRALIPLTDLEALCAARCRED